MYVPPAEVPLDGHFTEKIWSNPVGDHIAAYAKSKTLAEQAAITPKSKKKLRTPSRKKVE